MSDARGEAKRRAIRDAALGAFLAGGFRGTSMDEIAAAAHVSKQTVYKHFSGKERLFAEIVTSTVAGASAPMFDVAGALGELAEDELEPGLRAHARRQLDAALRPEVLSLRRLVIAEAVRFPELGRLFFDQGAGRTTAVLGVAFARLHERGLLDVPDVDLAALHFNWLVMAAPVNEAMLLGSPPPAPALDRLATTGVRTFLAAYRPR